MALGGKLEVFVISKAPRRAAWLSTHVTHGALVGACGAPAIRDEAGSQDAIVVGRCAAREGRSAHVVLVRSLRAHARHSTLFNHFHRTGLLSALALARGTAVAWLAGWAQLGSLAVGCLSIVLRDHASASGSAVFQFGRLCAAFSCI